MTKLYLQPHMIIIIIAVTTSVQAKNMLLHVKREVRARLVLICTQFADP